MAARRQWTVSPFSRDAHGPGALKLWAAVGGFDGSVPARTPEELDAILAHPASQGGAAWRVAVAGNDAVVGVLEVRFVGTRRTELSVAVNPAWRRQGIARALFQALPEGRRLLTSSRASLDGASAFLRAMGFQERWRDLRLRRAAADVEPPKLPSWATLEEDASRDVDRFLRVAKEALAPDEVEDREAARLILRRPGARVLYLQTPQGDQGVVVTSALDRAKKAERDADGRPTVGVLEHVGLAKPCRGRGLSRPFVRAGLQLLADAGYVELEVIADGRREQAVEVYRREGFEVVDEEIRWIRRDDE